MRIVTWRLGDGVCRCRRPRRIVTWGFARGTGVGAGWGVGGDAVVELEADGSVTLTGPSVYIADVVIGAVIDIRAAAHLALVAPLIDG